MAGDLQSQEILQSESCGWQGFRIFDFSKYVFKIDDFVWVVVT